LKNSLKNADKIKAFVLADDESIYKDFEAKIIKLGGLESLEKVNDKVENTQSFIVKGQQFFLELNQEIDVEAKRAELEEKLKYAKGFLISVQKKLSNERFVNNAPEKVVALEKQKLADKEAEIKLLEESLGRL